MELSDLVKLLESIAPPELAEEFDNGKIGLIVPGYHKINKVATALDPTPFVIQRAIDMHAEAIVVHHTLIWNPVTALTTDMASVLKLLLENDISLYSMHTNYDRAPGGVNDTLAGLLDLNDSIAVGLCRAGVIEPQASLADFAGFASSVLNTDVEVVGRLNKEVRTVVTAAGSAFREALPIAKQLNADVLVSSELRHDVIRDRGNVALISAPHYFTEAPAMKKLAERLNKNVRAEFVDDPPELKVIRQ